MTLVYVSNCNGLCICASQMITLHWFCKSYVSTVYLQEYIKISDIGQTEFDRLLFCLIYHGTFPVLVCLSLQVLDQKYFAAPTELDYFFWSYTVDSWWLWRKVRNNLCHTLKVIRYMIKNMKLDTAINYVWYWLLLLNENISMFTKLYPSDHLHNSNPAK